MIFSGSWNFWVLLFRWSPSFLKNDDPCLFDSAFDADYSGIVFLKMTILLYGSETWTLNKQLLSELDSFGTNCYRYILGIRRGDRIPNKTIYEKVKQTPLSNKLVKRQLAWVGHILRYDSNEPVWIYDLYEHYFGGLIVILWRKSRKNES